MIDFSNSFFLWETTSGSEGRFIVESITEIINDDRKDIFLLLSSVMACDVYGQPPLFHNPPYLFEAVFGINDVKIFRTYLSKTDHSVNRITDLFKSTKFLCKTSLYHKLESFDMIAESVRKGCSLVGEVYYTTDNEDIITIKFPIKHINISEKKRIFQVETGKHLFYQESLEKSSLAFLAFNNFFEINFMIQDENTNSVYSQNAKVNIYKLNI